MQLTLKTEGLASVQKLLKDLGSGQIRQATALALTDTGFQVRRAMLAEIKTVFDRPTPFIAQAPKVRKATVDRLSVAVLPTMHSEGAFSRGGKVGVDPQDVLQAQEWGGQRRDKKSEAALRRIGLLPAGYQTVIPAEPYPGSDDGRGNLSGRFMQQLLSYLQVFGEQGYKANMKRAAKRRFESARNYSNVRTRRQHVQRNQRFFVTMGHLRGGASSHLQPGIWAARGTHGVDLRPVLLFVRTPSYQPRISMARIERSVGTQAYLERRLRYRLRAAAGV